MSKRRRRRSDFHIHLNDECPRIGSGLRGIQVVKLGRKWVRFRETATGFTGKLDLRTFESAKRNPKNAT